MSTPATTGPEELLRVAMIGCGRPRFSAGATGFGMAHRHMDGYRLTGRCVLAAVADTNEENGRAFVAEHQPDAAVFRDYLEMMEVVRPDVVSICLWPHLHAEVVCAIAPLKPRIIFCEKPMDTHWDASLRMHAACEEHGVLLAINHQRRYNLPLMKAKELLDDGAIGRLERMEGGWNNIADAGTHVLDMMFYFNNDEPVDWVLGQIDMREPQTFFGMLHAGHGITEFRFRNAVRAIYHFGHQHAELGCLLRLHGERGIIEIVNEEPWLRVLRYGIGRWEAIDTGEDIHDDKGIHRAIADVIEAGANGRATQLGSTQAIRATEVIFATHESSRRRARVDLPLPADHCAMLALIDAGELVVEHTAPVN